MTVKKKIVQLGLGIAAAAPVILCGNCGRSHSGACDDKVKNGLDKSEKIAYNKSKESTPVDGLLPSLSYLK